MLDFESRFSWSTKIYLMHTYFIKGRTRNSNKVNKRRKWAFVTINKCNTKVSFKLYWEVLLKRQPKTCVLTRVNTMSPKFGHTIHYSYCDTNNNSHFQSRFEEIWSSEHSQGLHQKDYCIEFHSGVTFSLKVLEVIEVIKQWVASCSLLLHYFLLMVIPLQFCSLW